MDRAIALKPGFHKPYLARAQVHLRQGRPAEALADINTVLASLPPDKHAEVLNDRADVYRRSAGSMRPPPITVAPSIEPKGIDSSVGLALILEKQNQSEQAKQCYDRLVAADPDSASALLRRAEYSRDHGQFAAALADCDRAARLDPKSGLPGLVRAGVEAARGNDARAGPRRSGCYSNRRRATDTPSMQPPASGAWRPGRPPERAVRTWLGDMLTGPSPSSASA